MKKNLIPMAAAFAMFSFVACNNGSEETTASDSSSTTSSETTTTGSSGDASATTGAATGTTSGTATFNESTSYVDLQSGKQVKLRRDAGTGYITNQESNSPILFYYDPVTHDTFNREGMVVNNYLLRSPSGTYSLDESRWKTKVDEDGDIKAKDGEESKIKIDGNEPEVKVKTEDTKVKADENSYKSKGPDGKVKSKDDKTKVKTTTSNQQ